MANNPVSFVDPTGGVSILGNVETGSGGPLHHDANGDGVISFGEATGNPDIGLISSIGMSEMTGGGGGSRPNPATPSIRIPQWSNPATGLLGYSLWRNTGSQGSGAGAGGGGGHGGGSGGGGYGGYGGYRSASGSYMLNWKNE